MHSRGWESGLEELLLGPVIGQAIAATDTKTIQYRYIQLGIKHTRSRH